MSMPAMMHVDVVRHALAVHLRAEDRVPEDQVLRHDAGAQHLALGVDVVEEEVERLDALLEAALAACPIPLAARMRGMMSNGISRSVAVGLAVDGEGDADAAEQKLGLAPAVLQHLGRDLPKPAGQVPDRRAGSALRPVHLVERGRHPSPEAGGRSARLRDVNCKPRANERDGSAAGSAYRRFAHLLG